MWGFEGCLAFLWFEGFLVVFRGFQGFRVLSAVPASSRAVRRLVLVNSQQTEPSAAAISEHSSGVRRDQNNRFEALREIDEV